MMEEFEIIEKIKEYFEDNYETMRLEGGHAITEDIKQIALTQVLLYFEKMKDVATRVTHTEVKLTLPDQKTPKGRNFTIEGVVDIVRDDDETWKLILPKLEEKLKTELAFRNETNPLTSSEKIEEMTESDDEEEYDEDIDNEQA